MSVYMLTTEDIIRPVTCPSSPTGAHWYNCQYQLDGLVGHPHEFQTCKYCGFVQISPCYWCQPKAQKAQTKGERFNRTLPKKKKAA